ncbi:MAG: NYN domain-containing protein [Acidobacteria bacterium]|nr:NYN domain-containing protein [Acidobacteriota bacterium]
MGYVDSFNLYFGLRSKGWSRFFWLDVSKLIDSLAKPGQIVSGVRYFIAPLIGPSQKQKQQKTLLDAYGRLEGCSVYYGKYQNTLRRCAHCGIEIDVPSEKMTDVNIAVELLSDAVLDSFDAALLISADSDLTPVILKVRALFPGKRVIAAFPPGRFSQSLALAAHGYLVIGRAKLAASQLPDQIKQEDGSTLVRPEGWK